MKKDFWIHQNRNKMIDFKNFKIHHHAYLILGPKNIGKSTLALKLAQIFLNNKEINNHPDLKIIKPDDAKNPKISIQTIKEVKNLSQLSSGFGGNKVFIIQSAEKMTIQAQNALLKTLEEPCEKTIFILTAQSEKLLLPTILSRCQKIKIPNFSQKQIKNQLDKELSENAEIISRFSIGKPGLALKLSKDKDLFSEILNDFEEIRKIVKNKDIVDRFQKAGEFSSPEHRNQFAEYFEIFFRDLLHVKLGLNNFLINYENQKELINISNNYSISEILEILKEIKKLKLSIIQNVNSKFAFENLMLIL